jgi:hypothetical protein
LDVSAGSLRAEASLVDTQVGVSDVVGLFNAGGGIFLDASAGSFNAGAILVDTQVGGSDAAIGLFNTGVGILESGF